MKHRRTRVRAAAALAVEPLEGRRMMTTTPWGAFPKLIGLDQAVANYPAVTGKGQTIVFIDTGLNYNDPVFGGGIGPGHRVVAGYDFVDNDSNPMDGDGHGTGVVSQAAATAFTYGGAQYQGVAPGANIIELRVDTGSLGWAKEAPLIEKALQWVIAHRTEYNISVVNMSLGKGHYTDPTTMDPFSDELSTLNDAGVFLVAASGNSGVKTPATIEYPAADPNVYGVGSINVNDVISDFTERNQYMDVLAPGELVPLVYYLPASNSRSIFQGTGTSFATAYVAGVAALLKQVDPTLTPAEIMSLIQRGGANNVDGDKEAAPTTGLTFKRLNVNGALALAFAERDDAHEQNDALASATTIAFAGDHASLASLKSLAGDADYYKFTLGVRADVDFAVTHTGADAPTVALLNSGGTVIKTLSAADAVGNLAAGTYYLRVAAPAESLDGTYGLSVSRFEDDGANNQSTAAASPITLDSSGHGQATGRVLIGGADDYYRLDLTGTNDVVFTVASEGAGAGPAAQLLDANGVVVANFTGGGTLTRESVAAGRYYVRVYGAATLEDTYRVGVDATEVVVVPPPPPPPPPPDPTTPGGDGSANQIAYDAAGTLHLIYFDEAAKVLKYATRTKAGVWSATTVVDPTPNAGGYPSMALDSSGRPGVAYFDVGSADLKYARLVGSAWVVETVDSKLITGYYPSLRYTNAGLPVVSYYSKSAGDLRLAARSAAGKWTISTVDSGGDVGRSSSLAVNPATGRWAIAYEDTTHGDFKYAEQGKSAWVLTTVDSSTLTGGGNISLAFNPATKRPAFSYYDAYNADLKLASFTGTKWAVQTLAAKNIVGTFSNLRITPAGTYDVLYYNRNADSVYRAVGKAGGAFGLTQVLTDGGKCLSRAVDADGGETLAFVRDAGLAFLDS